MGYVPEILSVYRVHPGGVWSRKTEAEQASSLLELLDAYNEFLGFEFDAEFAEHRRVALKSLRWSSWPGARRLGRRIKTFLPPGLRRGLSD